MGSFKQLPPGYLGGYFLKVPTPYPLGKVWANCFSNLNELPMDLLGILPPAPSVLDEERLKRALFANRQYSREASVTTVTVTYRRESALAWLPYG